MIKVFIGYDPKESAAYHVLTHSIVRRSSVPVSITPIRRSTLKHFWRRPVETNHSTEFSLSRFLTPFLSDYEGWAIFMDCDMLMQADIRELWDLRDENYAVQVCKHDYTPKSDIKMLGSVQTRYPMKNWSSLMLMNCARCQELTVEYVNGASGLELHQFHWADSIGSLPLEWNWLLGEYDDADAKCLHWTLGGPWWHQYADAPMADVWRAELGSMLHETEDDWRHATTRLLQTAAAEDIQAATSRAGALA